MPVDGGAEGAAAEGGETLAGGLEVVGGLEQSAGGETNDGGGGADEARVGRQAVAPAEKLQPRLAVRRQ